jgi:predicted porin
MKRTLIVAAALASLGVSAFAQSNVTLYGRLNVTIERQKLVSGTNDWVMQNNSSRWGLKGSEDLGGGMAAGFQLEAGFNPATGASVGGAGGPGFWGRQSELNLGGSFGKVRLGNFLSEAYEASADYVGMHNHETGTSQDAFYAYIGRSSSKIAYRTPSFSGATLEAAVTEGGTLNRTYDFAFNYDAGPLHLGAGYEKNSPTNKNAKEFSARALYEMGAFTFGGYVQRDTDGWGTGLGDRTSLRLAGMYVIGSTELHLNYGHAGDYNKTAADTKANQYTLEVNQNLSKRTKVYAFYTKLNGDGANFYAGGNSGVPLTSSFAVGVRHNF